MNLDQFKHSVALDALSLTSVLTPLLHQYRTGLDQAVLANRVRVEMSVVHHGNAEDAWMAVPADGEAGFMKGAVRVSLQLQKTLRCWLQMQWFADAENLTDTAKTTQLLAYLACKLYTPRAKDAYAYDLLDDWSSAALERNIKSDMPDALARVANLLRISGKHDLADYYDPSHASWFVSEIERNGKMFREILARESRIVHAWVPLIGARVKEKQLENARRETRIALNEIFRRGEDLGYLAPLFEIEVVAALELYIGRPIGRSLSLAGNPERAPESVALLCGRDNSNVIPFPVMTRLEQRKPRRIVPFSLIDAEEAA
jgi:hypothetical protein